MASLGNLTVTVGAQIEGFEKSMGTVSQRLNAIDRDTSKAISGFDRIGDRLTASGTALTAGITVPLVAAAGTALKFATDFELGMRRASSLIGGQTEDQFKQLTKQTLELSKALGIDTVDAVNGVYEAIQHGIPEENVFSFVEVASKAAIASSTDVATAVQGLSTVIDAYSLSATDAKAISDVFFQAVNVGNLSFGELSSSIGIAAGTANLLHISYQELVAAGATLTRTTGQGISEAMTMLQSAMKALIEPSVEMKDLLKQMGYESGVTAVQSLGLEGTLQGLEKAAGGNVEVFEKAFGRIEGFRGAVGLSGQNAKLASEHLETMRHAADGVGASAAAYNDVNKAASRQFDILLNQLKASAVEMGLSLLPAVNSLLAASKPLVQFLSEAVQWFTSLPSSVQTTALAMTALAAAIGPMLGVTGLLIKGWIDVSAAIFTSSGAIKQFGPLLMDYGVAMQTGFIGPLTLGQTALVSFGKTLLTTAGYIGALFVGYQIGNWLADIHDANVKAGNFERGLLVLGNRTKELDDKLRDGVITLDQYRKAIENAGFNNQKTMGPSGVQQQIQGIGSTSKTSTATVADLVKELDKYGVSIVQGKQSTSDYREALLKQLAALKESGIATKQQDEAWREANKTTLKSSAATIQQLSANQNLRNEFEKSKKVYKEISDLQKQGAVNAQGQKITLNDVAFAQKNMEAAARAAGIELHNLNNKTGDATSAQKVLDKQLSDAQNNLRTVQDLYERHRVGMDAVVIATKEVEKAQAALDKQFLDLHPTLNKTTGSVAEFTAKTLGTRDPLKDLQSGLSATNLDAEVAADSIDLMGQVMADAVLPVDKLANTLKTTAIPAYTVADAFRELGTTTSASLYKAAHDAELAFTTIQQEYEQFGESTGITAADVNAAWQTMTDRKLAYARSINDVEMMTQLEGFRRAHIDSLTAIINDYSQRGQEVPAAMQIQLAKLIQQERDYQANSVAGWAAMWNSIRGNMSDVFQSFNRTLVTGDWANFKDRFIGDLQNIGESVITKFLKPTEDAISNFVATTLSDLLSGKGFGGVLDSLNNITSSIPGLSKSLDNVFGRGGILGTGIDQIAQLPNLIGNIGGMFSNGIGAGALSNDQLSDLFKSIPIAGGGAVGGASSAVSGILGSAMSFLNPISAISNVVGGIAEVLQLFGVGRGGEKDRLNNISDYTWSTQWALGEGGMRIATLDMRNEIVNWMSPGIYQLKDVTAWYGEIMIDHLGAIRNSFANGGGGVTVNINGYNRDPRELAEEVSRIMSQNYAFQGGY